MDIQPLEILKWIGIVLAAGFIGYFGRYLAMLIIERMRKRKSQPTPAAESPEEVSAGQGARIEESKLKLEKKRAKAQAKRVKKGRKK